MIKPVPLPTTTHTEKLRAYSNCCMCNNSLYLYTDSDRENVIKSLDDFKELLMFVKHSRHTINVKNEIAAMYQTVIDNINTVLGATK